MTRIPILFQLFFLLFIPASVAAELPNPPSNDPPLAAPFREGILNGRVGFHLTPTGLLGSFRGLRFGGQVRTGRLIFGGDVLLGNQTTATLLFSNAELLDYRATGFYPEVKYIIAEEGETAALYVSAVVPIRMREASFGGGSFVDFEQDLRFDIEAAQQEHRKVSVGFKVGAIKAMGPRLYWEYYAGFGLGERLTSYSGMTSLNPDTVQPAEASSIDGDLLSARQCFQLDLLFGLRLGVRL